MTWSLRNVSFSVISKIRVVSMKKLTILATQCAILATSYNVTTIHKVFQFSLYVWRKKLFQCAQFENKDFRSIRFLPLNSRRVKWQRPLFTLN